MQTLIFHFNQNLSYDEIVREKATLIFSVIQFEFKYNII